MSNLNNYILAAVLLFGAGADSVAEIEVAVEDSPRAVDLKNGESLKKARSLAIVATSGRLRCWQSGRLVYEGKGVISAEKSTAATDIYIRNDRSAARVFDMKEGLCVMDYPESDRGVAR